jgi:hypothetical protein
MTQQLFTFDEIVLKNKGKIVKSKKIGKFELDRTNEVMIEWLIKYEGLK